MEIRQLRAEDFEARMELSQFAFQYKLTAERLEEERRYFQPEEHWGAFDEQGRLLSALRLIPFDVYIEGKAMRMGGVAGVASWPESRRGGNVTRLLTRSLEAMREKGQTVSMLHPFSFPFYRRFGWEFTIERKRYEIEMAMLPKRKDGAGSVERVSKVDARELAGLYELFAARYNGMLKRTNEWWSRRVLNKDGIAAIWRSGSGSPEGYLLYEVQNRTLTVHDWAWTGEEARAGLWHFIANHDSMADRIHITVPADDPLPFLLPDPRIKQELVPYFMSRIVDVAALAAQYPFQPAAADGSGEERLTLEVRDEYAPWNNRRFALAFAPDGVCRVAAATAAAETPAAACDIRALAALLLGGRRPLRLREAGLLQGDAAAAALLERRVPVRQPYLADFF